MTGLLFVALLAEVACGQFTLPARWEYSSPYIAPESRQEEPSRAQKDPTVVFHEGAWHFFMTVKLPGRTAIEYCTFKKWEDAQQSKRYLLNLTTSKYFGAPQVFYFAPQKRWYLVYQAGMPGAKKMWVAYSTTTTLGDPASWSKAKPILDGGPDDPRKVGGLDYWIICDAKRAYLFHTSLDGRMWRLSTRLEDFPGGFGQCELALRGNIFEASHTYKIKGQEKFLTIIEQKGQRHQKAYIANRLDGEWKPLADTFQKPFAGAANVRPAAGVERWTDNISHGELIRDSNDQQLIIDPAKLQFVFQGMLQKHKQGKGYGAYQWRIGILAPVAE